MKVPTQAHLELPVLLQLGSYEEVAVLLLQPLGQQLSALLQPCGCPLQVTGALGCMIPKDRA